jgi:NTP pyrophosphatase (non-canonical NTP hydrolase)
MPAPKQQNVTLEELNQKIWTHLEARDWHNNPTRGLAISMALEANELLEHYQWDDNPVGGADAVGEELADVFIYGMQIAQQNNVDLAAMIERKLEKAAKKYPASDFKGKKSAEKHAAWMKNKLAFQKEGL